MKLFLLRRILFLTLCLISTISASVAADDTELLRALSTPNHFALIRHALAPGNGDPDGFKIGDCSTQRNLSDIGRKQAVKMGDILRDNGIEEASIFSSQWCRCDETAKLLGFPKVHDNPILNSFYQQWQNSERQTTDLEQWLTRLPLEIPTLLVTHQVNISAFAKVYPSSGDMVIVKRNEDDTFSVLGSVSTSL